MQRIKLPQIQGHYLTLALKEDSTLTLEIEEEASGKIFSLDLDEDSIDQVTDGLFQTAEDLFRGLQDGANSRCPGLTLNISKGKLIYTVVISTESVQKYSFILNLTEKRVDQVEILERQLKLLKESKERSEAENEEKFQRLENMMIQMEQKMAQRLDLERLSDSIKAFIPLKLNACFNHNSVNISKFVLSDNNKTASLKQSTQAKQYPCLEVLPQIPSNGKYSYSFRTKKRNNSETLHFGFGIMFEPKKEENLDFYYCYSTLDGRIIGREEKEPVGNGPFGGNDKIYEMVIDMDQGTLTFFLDNMDINACSISKSEKYFAFIVLRDAGDSVTLI